VGSRAGLEVVAKEYRNSIHLLKYLTVDRETERQKERKKEANYRQTVRRRQDKKTNKIQ
jgi:hypothetical protein